MKSPFIATVHSELNASLGGGVVSSGLVEIYGDEGVGKTATAISLSEHADVAFIDMDGTFPHQLVDLVGRRDRLALAQLFPNSTTDELEEFISPLVRELDAVVIDPIGCLPWHVVSELVPILSRLSSQHQMLILLINHANAFQESTSEAVCSFYCKQRIQMSTVDASSEAMRVQFRTTKNLMHPPFAHGTLRIPFDEQELAR